MILLKPEVDAAEVGLDRARLERLDRHFARYVDDGRLPGWLITVSRYGRLAHVSRCGSRDIEAGLEVEPDTLWRVYSMTKPVTSVAAMMLYEEGALELTEPVSAFIPSFAHVRVLSGGAGLVSTAADYHRFTQMLLHCADSPAGELDGIRLLGPRTVSYMARNHLPGGLDLHTFGRPLYAEFLFHGVGFGLGFAVVTDPTAAKVVCSAGELSWGGAASTAFWIDPREQLTVSFFTQLLPSSAHRIRPQLRQLVYQALTG
jgi:CubicO group peptidase (beta-lactamase class C family)